jgi:hypothetical protein
MRFQKAEWPTFDFLFSTDHRPNGPMPYPIAMKAPPKSTPNKIAGIQIIAITASYREAIRCHRSECPVAASTAKSAAAMPKTKKKTLSITRISPVHSAAGTEIKASRSLNISLWHSRRAASRKLICRLSSLISSLRESSVRKSTSFMIFVP